MEYSLAPTDDLSRFWRSTLKGQGHSRLSRWQKLVHPSPMSLTLIVASQSADDKLAERAWTELCDLLSMTV